MKKLLTIASVLFLVSLTTTVQAQLRFGVRGGANFSKIDVKEIKSNTSTGWFLGPSCEFLIPVVGLGLDAAFMYSQEKTKFTRAGVASNEKMFKVHRLILPVNIKYKFPIPFVSPFIFAGPEFDFNLKDNADSFKGFVSNVTDRDTYDAKGANISLNIGAGVELFDRLDVFVNYNYGLNDTLKDFDSNTKLWRVGGTVYF